MEAHSTALVAFARGYQHTLIARVGLFPFVACLLLSHAISGQQVKRGDKKGMKKEATARVKINKHPEQADWGLIDDDRALAWRPRRQPMVLNVLRRFRADSDVA